MFRRRSLLAAPLLAPCIAPGIAAAQPDGYTLALGNNQTHAANAAMVRDLPYRPVEDFAPIGRLAEVHHALVVPANSPARTLADLAARGRGGGKLIYASS